MLYSTFCAQEQKLFVMFFKCDLKIVRHQISEKHHKRFSNASQDVVGFLKTYDFLITLEKYHKRYFFSTYNIFVYVPLSAINGDQLGTFDKKYFFLVNLPSRKYNYIYV